MTQIRKLVNDVIYMYMMLFSTIWFNQTINAIFVGSRGQQGCFQIYYAAGVIILLNDELL